MKPAAIAAGCNATLAALLLAAAPPAAAQALTPQALYRQAAPSVVVVEVRSDDGKQVLMTGSGVVVQSDGNGWSRIATNCHVVKDAPTRIRFGDGFGSTHTSATGFIFIHQGNLFGVGEIEGKDAKHDLCSIKATWDADSKVDTDLSVAVLGNSRRLQVGDPVYAIGTPQGLESTLSTGIVSGFRNYRGDTYIQTTAAISPGSSGGGLFDAQGRLVGITTVYLENSQSLNFAAPVEWIAAIPPAPTRDRWLQFGESNDSEAFFDMQTISKQGRNVTVWEKEEFKTPQKWNGITYVESVVQKTYFCDSRESSTLNELDRDAQGNVVFSRQFERWEQKRNTVIPGTSGEFFWEEACKLL